jgi:outer membrane immunogenic protein
VKKILIAIAALLTFADLPARAADLLTKAEPRGPIGYQWAGPYVGINGGYAFGRRQDVVDFETINDVFSTSGMFGSLDPRGGFGGVQFGVNALQYRSWVFGLEMDFQGAAISSSSAGTVLNFLPGNLNAAVNSSNKVEAFGTIRPRLGYAWDRVLIYTTGGFAWGQVKHDFAFADNFNFRAENSTNSMQGGYVVGGGFEYAFAPNLSAKVEYQYIDLGTAKYTAPLLFCGATPCVATVFAEHTSVRNDFHTVRLGLNWRFASP